MHLHEAPQRARVITVPSMDVQRALNWRLLLALGFNTAAWYMLSKLIG